MGRFSIARSLRLALVGLAVVLAVVAAAGIASLYSARQHYEDVLVPSSDLATAVANLTSAGVVQTEILRDARARAPPRPPQAAAAFDRAAPSANSLAASDPPSARLVAEQITLERQAARLAGRRADLRRRAAAGHWPGPERSPTVSRPVSGPARRQGSHGPDSVP